MHDFITWWQHLPYDMNPIIFSVGPVAIRWYGTMYIIAFAIVWLLSKYRIATEKLPFDKSFPGDALTWAMGGVLIGGRLGYILFYGFEWFLQDPIGTLLPFNFGNGTCAFAGITGMSFHGGLIGVALALWLFTRKHKVDFLKTVDLFIPALPLGYTFGRLGNFINGELYGRVTTSAIGMYFPAAPTVALRHPSQLYEAFFEGIVLFIILWSIRKKAPWPGFLSGLYLIGYGTVRFFIEFYREPDAQLGFVFLNFSMGQVLCFLMIAAGIGILVWSKRRAAGAVASENKK
ncbi:prolipoprotein diacylglyceryl transferase [Chlorobaculum parvum NCIB 8327]|uniref:Phosphatidylglycerol--prolipoprotein diacylglyceryl transferase n=1 Tax=Chlorobaculum parvum (strain DSM 263 / NCIMB 8327) TaxID=517417 RepID=B3QNB2_CHLP8|nr:prolipoprotein diacylglyceryl transferase [Chlorobaculum parvum]ACF11415.1 prolipoprotein diacylglyceryl transferase [Chlorobaculum parvum NCIB 8327]